LKENSGYILKRGDTMEGKIEGPNYMLKTGDTSSLKLKTITVTM
jgi:hypothetical protein